MKYIVLSVLVVFAALFFVCNQQPDSKKPATTVDPLPQQKMEEVLADSVQAAEDLISALAEKKAEKLVSSLFNEKKKSLILSSILAPLSKKSEKIIAEMMPDFFQEDYNFQGEVSFKALNGLGRYHTYWRVTDGLEPDSADVIQKLILEEVKSLINQEPEIVFDLLKQPFLKQLAVYEIKKDGHGRFSQSLANQLRKVLKVWQQPLPEDDEALLRQYQRRLWLEQPYGIEPGCYIKNSPIEKELIKKGYPDMKEWAYAVGWLERRRQQGANIEKLIFITESFARDLEALSAKLK